MSVFIVVHNNWDENENVAVFSTKESAETFVTEWNKTKKNTDGTCEIQEWMIML